MKEITGDLWDYLDDGFIVITTNGIVNRKGECVMGRGTAYQARNRYPKLPIMLGNRIKKDGNHVFLFRIVDVDTGKKSDIITFPVKHHWMEPADPELITRSVGELIALANRFPGSKFFLPRPGCNNGRLHWEDVKPLLKSLDDRFTVVERHP